jgi:hypothetical protein
MEFHSPVGRKVYQVTPGCAESFRPAIGATQAIKYLALLVGLLSYYAGDNSFGLYLFSSVLALMFVRTIELRILLVLGLLIGLVLFRWLIYPEFLYETIRDIRFFWGFVVFLLFFSSERRARQSGHSDYKVFFGHMVDLLLILLLVEFLTSNIFLIQWPNRQHDFIYEIEQGVARAYGFGGNASVTAALIIVICSVLFRRYGRDLLVLGMATSATGALLFAVKLFARTAIRARLLAAVAVASVMLYSKEIAEVSGVFAIEKISIAYFQHVLGVKMDQFQAALASPWGYSGLLLGQPFELNSLRTGDFQMLDYLVFNGLGGLVLFAAVVSLHLNSLNALPIFLLLLGSFHYQAAFSIPGQVVLAWLLSLKVAAPNGGNSLLRQRAD